MCASFIKRANSDTYLILGQALLADLAAIKPPAADERKFSALVALFSLDYRFALRQPPAIEDLVAIAGLAHALGLSTCFYDPEYLDLDVRRR